MTRLISCDPDDEAHINDMIRNLKIENNYVLERPHFFSHNIYLLYYSKTNHTFNQMQLIEPLKAQIHRDVSKITFQFLNNKRCKCR